MKYYEKLRIKNKNHNILKTNENSENMKIKLVISNFLINS